MAATTSTKAEHDPRAEAETSALADGKTTRHGERSGSASRKKRSERWLERYRTPLLWLAAVRAVLAVAALPLAPFLYKKHFILLVLLRPTKEVLLAAGFAIKRGDLNPVLVVAAAVPLAIFAVWHTFLLGRAYAEEIRTGDGLPRFAERLLPPKRIKQLCQALDEKGSRVIFLGRLATFPSSLLGASAGASGMEGRSFFPADLAGALAGIAEVLVAGYLLGEAYKQAGPWLTGVGVVALLGMLFVLGRTLRRGKKGR